MTTCRPITQVKRLDKAYRGQSQGIQASVVQRDLSGRFVSGQVAASYRNVRFVIDIFRSPKIGSAMRDEILDRGKEHVLVRGAWITVACAAFGSGFGVLIGDNRYV